MRAVIILTDGADLLTYTAPIIVYNRMEDDPQQQPIEVSQAHQNGEDAQLSPQDPPEPHEQAHQPYYRAARFVREREALETYTKLQQLIFRESCDLSAYRFLLEQVSHVLVIGTQPSEALDTRLANLLKEGKQTTLPADIVQMLNQRRNQARQHGTWVEGHYRPGKHLRRQP